MLNVILTHLFRMPKNAVKLSVHTISLCSAPWEKHTQKKNGIGRKDVQCWHYVSIGIQRPKLFHHKLFLLCVDASYVDPLGPQMDRPKTGVKKRVEDDDFADEELGDDLLPE